MRSFQNTQEEKKMSLYLLGNTKDFYLQPMVNFGATCECTHNSVAICSLCHKGRITVKYRSRSSSSAITKKKCSLSCLSTSLRLDTSQEAHNLNLLFSVQL